MAPSKTRRRDGVKRAACFGRLQKALLLRKSLCNSRCERILLRDINKSLSSMIAFSQHRDLHWGQILVRRIESPITGPLKNRSNAPTMFADDPSHGVQATIIDLGLARLDRIAADAGGEETYWTPLAEEIFEGEGDYQYDVYRMMRKHNGDEWREYKPLTNVMVRHFLCRDKVRNLRTILSVVALSRQQTPDRQEPPRADHICLCADVSQELAVRREFRNFRVRLSRGGGEDPSRRHRTPRE